MKIENIKVEKLIPYARNAKLHNEQQVASIAGSIKEFGFNNPVLIDQKDGIIAGHGRVLAARKLGQTEVPCLRLSHLNENQKRAYIIADNRLSETGGGWDKEMLSLELEEIDFSEFEDFKITDFDFEVDGIFEEQKDSEDEIKDADAKIEDADDLNKKWQVNDGDTWIIGDNKLLCGSSMKIECVQKLMGNSKADMTFTDPPYGVNYTGKTKKALKIENDSLCGDELDKMIRNIFDGVDTACKRGSYVLATVPAGPLEIKFASDWERRGWLRQIMVWNKDCMVLGHSEYHYKHEPILFGWIPGGERLKNTDRTKTTVWDFKKPSASREHPTMKPVDMWCYGISQHTKKGEIVYEPCLGSGTTMVASQNIGRKCYGIEISPNYCAVILQRMSETFPELEIKREDS